MTEKDAQPGDVLDQLRTAAETVREATRQRDRLILEARLAGWPWPAIMKATGLARSGLNYIATRENGGTYPTPTYGSKRD